MTVLFNNNFVWEAHDVLGIAMTSINSASEAYESAALEFLDVNGNPFSVATYNGYWATPPIGAVGGSTSPVVNTSVWTGGTGTFLANSTATISTTGTGTLSDPVAGTNGPNNNATVSATDTGLSANTIIGGFRWTVYVEDIASLDSNGDGVADLNATTTLTSLTATLNSISFNAPQAVPEPSSFALLGMAAVGFGIWRRRRLLSKASA